jgi:diacylglycerol kinase (ATP)
VIYNPVAGGFRGRRRARLERVLGLLASEGFGITPVPTTGPRTAGPLAKECISSGADLILAAGGDGTINEIAAGMVHSDVPLGILPAGTANVLARELGIGCDLTHAAQLLATCAPKRVAVGLLHYTGKTGQPAAHSRHFLCMAGIGFDAHIVYGLDLKLKSKLGQFAYWTSAAKEIGRDLEEFEVRTEEGGTFRSSFGLASRVKNYAGYMEIARQVNLLSDDFELVLFEGRSTFRFYSRYLPAIVARIAHKVKGLTFVRTRKAEFRCPEGTNVHIQIDGEYVGRLPAAVETLPGALTLLVPPGYPRI